ncbi:MAG: hypothetical protein GY706_05545 [Bacteroides sp.]|nr:hypothetical protein [Bacteroides sp.]
MYSDGAIRTEKGYLVKPHPKGADPITSENSGTLRARAIQQRQEAAAQSIAAVVTERSIGNRLIGKADAWGVLAGQMAGLVYDADKDGDKINAFRALSDVTPAKYDKTMQIQQQSAPEQAQINLVAVFLQQISDEAGAIDAEIVEDDE